MPLTPDTRPLVGVSTKMYFTHRRTTAFISSVLSLLDSSPLLTTVQPFIIPDFISLPAVADAITSHAAAAAAAAGGGDAELVMLVGAQDCAAAMGDDDL